MSISMKLLEGQGVDLNKLTAAIQTRMRARVKTGMGRIASGANRRAPKGKTGTLSKSYKVAMFKTKIGGKAYSNDPVAHLIELGTAGAEETVSAKKVLADAEAGIFFGKKVKIPPMKPNPHLGPAADAEFPSMERDIEGLIGSAIDGA